MDNLNSSQAKIDTLADFLAIVDRIAPARGLTSDRQIAAALGMSKSNLSIFREKLRGGGGSESVPEKWWRNLWHLQRGDPDSLDKLARADLSGPPASRLQMPSSDYALPRHVVAPANPLPPDAETTWDEVVGYCYALKTVGTQPESVLRVLQDEFPIARIPKKERTEE